VKILRGRKNEKIIVKKLRREEGLVGALFAIQNYHNP
jgi:hypothetical protein